MLEVKVNGEVSGYFIMTATKPDGTTRLLAEFPNIITDLGLNQMATANNYLNYCQVGSGSATPAASDIALSSRIASTLTKISQTDGVQTSSPYFVWSRRTYRFAAGVATGNISEVGVSAVSVGQLFSRALVLDTMGAPTAITVLADEILDVAYEFRYYAKITDDTGSVTLTGGLGATYSWIFRPANIGTSNTSTGWYQNQAMNTGSQFRVYAGTIGSITTIPSGVNAVVNTMSSNAYVTGSFTQSFVMTAGPADGNIVGGIRSIAMKMGMGYFQLQLTPAIPKTAADTLALSISHTWARRP
ncbi:MAG: hypothetical protein ACLGID_13490 [Gammaproteobacteria bacterium]